MDEFGKIIINDFHDVEKFLGNFVWDRRFAFDIDTLALDKAPSFCTKDGKLRHSLRQLFEDSSAIKSFFLNNWHSGTEYGISQFTQSEQKTLSILLNSCIEYLDEIPLIKENLINSIINSYNDKLKQKKLDYDHEVDTTYDDFIKDCNEQFRSMMNDNDAWCNID